MHPLPITTIQSHSINHNLYYNNNKLIIPSLSHGISHTIDPTHFFKDFLTYVHFFFIF